MTTIELTKPPKNARMFGLLLEVMEELSLPDAIEVVERCSTASSAYCAVFKDFARLGNLYEKDPELVTPELEKILAA